MSRPRPVPPSTPPAARRLHPGRRAVLVLALLTVPGYLLFERVRDRWAVARAVAAEAAGDLAAAEAALDPLLGRAADDPEVQFLAARVGWRRRLDEPFPTGWERPVRRHLAAAMTAPWLVGRASGDEDAVSALCGDRAAERRLARRADRDGPDAVPMLEALARCHLDGLRPGAVKGIADRLLARRPDHALAHFWRGLAFDMAGRREGQALPDFRRAVELDPGSHAFRLQLALQLVGHKADLDTARGLLDGLRRETPDHPDVLRGLGLLLLSTDPAAARSEFARLVELRPDDGESLALLGQAELDTDRPAEAEPHLRAAVARTPGSFTANYQLFRLLAAAGRAAEAMPFQAAADRIEAERKRITAVSAEVAERPADPAPRTELGRLYLRAGADQLGVYWLESALETDPGYQPARQALADRVTAAARGGR